MPAYIRKYRVYQNSRPKKSISCQNNEYRRGHFTTDHGVQFYLQYLLSDREQHTGCQFQRPALRVLSLKEMCAPREELGGVLSRALSGSFSFINKTKTDTEPESL